MQIKESCEKAELKVKVSAPKAKKPAAVAKKEPPRAAQEPSVNHAPAKVVRGGGGGRAGGDAGKPKKGMNLVEVDCTNIFAVYKA